MAPRKPTHPFGTLNFGKDGKIHRDIRSLPPTQKGQEMGLAEAFKNLGAAYLPPGVSVLELPERDHDFEFLHSDGSRFATVQAVEIALANWTRPLSQAEWLGGGCRNAYYVSPAEMLCVDDDASEKIIDERIRQKVRKSYSKPAGVEFWLMVWAHGAEGHLSSSIQGGRRVESEAIRTAVRGAQRNGAGPFDKVFFFTLTTAPELIWPR